MSVKLIEIARFPDVLPLQGLFWGIFVKQDNLTGNYCLLEEEGFHLEILFNLVFKLFNVKVRMS